MPRFVPSNGVGHKDDNWFPMVRLMFNVKVAGLDGDLTAIYYVTMAKIPTLEI